MFRKTFLVLGASALLLTNVACHSEDVLISDNAFTPSGIDSSLGVLVDWTNGGSNTHDVKSSGGGVFFESDDLNFEDVFSVFFGVAGTYKYKCTFHPTEMTGSVQIPVQITNMDPPAQGDDVFVMWAFSEFEEYEIPTGFNVDVQLNKPGPGGFEDWRINQKGAETSDSFNAKKSGTYKIRARFQKGNGAATGYSTPVEVVIPAA